MTKFIKKIISVFSVLGVVALLGACSSDKGRDMTYYQTHSNDDIKRVSATMHTHSSGGGESRMGTIKFVEEDSGLKMAIDLNSLRPGVEYKIRVYELECNAKKKCEKDEMSVDLPMLKAGNNGKLSETFMIRGLTAKKLNNTKIVLSRDGNDGRDGIWDGCGGV